MRGSYLWHLEQAKLQELVAQSDARRGFHYAAQEALDRARKHRDRAAALNPAKAS
jgi:hypothetical protein